MPWFAAHAIMYYELTGVTHDRCSGFENVFVIEAANRDEARSRAESMASADESDLPPPLTVEGHPARLVYGGIRKVVTVFHTRGGDRLVSGDEVTSSPFEVADRVQLRRLIAGADAQILAVSDQDFEPDIAPDRRLPS